MIISCLACLLVRLDWLGIFKFSFGGICIFILIASHSAHAGTRFISNFPCSDTGKYCASSGTRVIDGIRVHRDCWEWAYEKRCDYPSKNDCSQYAHCYDLGDRDCIFRDSIGNCVNIKENIPARDGYLLMLNLFMVGSVKRNRG
jgi:hypothetical protein